MRGKRYGQLMVFSDIAANMQPPPFALFCIDADVLTGWKDVDAMVTTMEGNLPASLMLVCSHTLHFETTNPDACDACKMT